ncbi:MAG TPA: hypothetical protein VKA86_17380 [Candidatus Krumholzibacteria bacterium]|nr:hypothetical protein [Candidatus Krumholzibacteria bacterium]
MPTPDTRRDLIRALRDAPPRRWRVSLFMPTHRTGNQVRQDPIRFGNLVDEAERQIRACEDDGLPRAFEAMLRPARDLVGDQDFWNRQNGGLAVFLDPDGMEMIQVPDELTERCVVNERYHVKPLLPRLTGNAEYFVLTLSRNDVRLLGCTRDTVEVLPQGEIPSSLEEALGREVEHESLQGHIVHRQGGPGQLTFHGHGKGDDDRAEELLSFLQKVDAAVSDRIASQSGPVVLAGTDAVTSVYRRNSRLAERIVERTVTGSPDDHNPVELHDRSWPIVEATLDGPFERARSEHARLAGTGLTADQLEEVLAAVSEGRVRTLMVAIDDERWGRMDPETQVVEVHERQYPGDEDLVDRAAVLGRARGADVVYTVTADMPGRRPLAAVLHG